MSGIIFLKYWPANFDKIGTPRCKSCLPTGKNKGCITGAIFGCSTDKLWRLKMDIILSVGNIGLFKYKLGVKGRLLNALNLYNSIRCGTWIKELLKTEAKIVNI